MTSPTDEDWGIDPEDWLPYVDSTEPRRRAPGELLDGKAIAEPLPELEYLVRGIGLVAGGGAPHLVAGYGFSGKTIALQSMLLSLAAGLPVWGAHEARARRVAHVDFEQGERLTRARYQRLAVGMGADLAALGDKLVLSVMPPWRLQTRDRDHWKSVMEGRDLVLIDSLRAATGGQDENSSDFRSGLDMLGVVGEEMGCRALFIHHARKPVEGAAGGIYAIRGSGAILDASDGAYVFAADKGQPTRVEHVKARSHGETGEDFALAVKDVWDESGRKTGVRVELTDPHTREPRASLAERARLDRANEAAKRENAVTEFAREILARKPDITTREFQEEMGLRRERCVQLLQMIRGDS